MKNKIYSTMGLGKILKNCSEDFITHNELMELIQFEQSVLSDKEYGDFVQKRGKTIVKDGDVVRLERAK